MSILEEPIAFRNAEHYIKARPLSEAGLCFVASTGKGGKSMEECTYLLREWYREYQDKTQTWFSDIAEYKD